MERLITTFSKGFSSWGRRFLVQAGDALASLKDAALDSGSLFLCRARIALAEARFTTLKAIRSRSGSTR
ncbi:hypothetical protein [Synechococcus sp. H65.1]|uniref:hypothetical protein n=1 Tax=unclassified Synechococcus TaxID=2626047 RepID=UPI0039C1BF32